MAPIKPAPKDTVPVAPAEPSNDIKVEVRSTPIVVKTTNAEPTKPDLTVHHELTLTPSSEATNQPVEAVVPALEQEVSEVVVSPTAKPVAPKPPTDDAPKTDPRPAGEATPAKTEEMQSPKVFDTKKYHLPIDEGARGGKSKYLVIFMVVLLLAVVGLVAIDAGWIDIGFDLPFDLIK